jgi:hypothetical protein
MADYNLAEGRHLGQEREMWHVSMRRTRKRNRSRAVRLCGGGRNDWEIRWSRVPILFINIVIGPGLNNNSWARIHKIQHEPCKIYPWVYGYGYTRNIPIPAKPMGINFSH